MLGLRDGLKLADGLWLGDIDGLMLGENEADGLCDGEIEGEIDGEALLPPPLAV